MQVSDSFRRVNHSKTRSSFIDSLESGFNFSLFRMTFNFSINISETVIGIDFQFSKEVGIFGEDIFIINFDTVSENNGIRYFHHSSFHMERKHDFVISGSLDFSFEEFFKMSDTHA